MKKFFVIICLMLFSSCTQKEQDRKVFLKNELEIRIKNYKTKQIGSCKEEFIESVQYEVDSLMFFLVEKMKGSSIEMPQRPDRPGRLVDTISLEEGPK